MKALLAILITVGLLAACYVLSALIYFDVTGILIWLSALWVGIDSVKIKFNRYKTGLASKPVVLFCCCVVLWFIFFPWYLWARFKIKDGTAVLKEESPCDLDQQPARKFLRQLSRATQGMAEWVLIGLVALVFIFLVFCLEEAWRGKRVWETCKHQLEAKGVTLDWQAMIPPRVPDSQNFFSAPMMAKWFIKPSNKISDGNDSLAQMDYTNDDAPAIIADVTIDLPGSRRTSDAAGTRLEFDDPASSQRAKDMIQNVAGPSAFGTHDTFVLRSSSSVHIKPLRIFLKTDKKPTTRELIAFFTGKNSIFGPLALKPAGTNSYHVLTTFCAASDYLKWSDRFKADFDKMRDAVKRPYARMAGNYSSPLTIPTPNFLALRAVSLTLAQRAQCYLLLGQPEKALKELTLLNDLRRILECAPTGKPVTLVGAMINVAITGLYVNVVADGLRLHAWKEPQYALLQEQLGHINLAPFLKESFHVEQLMVLYGLRHAIARFDTPRVPDATLWQKIKNVQRPDVMKGFWIFNIVTIVKMDQMIVDAFDTVHKTVSLRKIAEFKREKKALDRPVPILHFSPYKIFAVIAVPDSSKALQTFAFVQTRVNEAQIVCALERYRLAEGHYPQTLDGLTPQFIAHTPHDIIGGQPLKYRLHDGRFTLYSIGWNETDDHGQFNPSSDKADWVWQ